MPGDDPSQVPGRHSWPTPLKNCLKVCFLDQLSIQIFGFQKVESFGHTAKQADANTWRLGGTMHSIVVLSPDPSMRFTVNGGGGIDTDNLSFSMGIPIDGHLATGILGGGHTRSMRANGQPLNFLGFNV